MEKTTYITRNFMIGTPSPYWDDKIKKNEMGEARGTYGGQKSCTQGFGGETSLKETSWKNQVVDGRIRLRRIFRKRGGARNGLIWLRIETHDRR